MTEKIKNKENDKCLEEISIVRYDNSLNKTSLSLLTKVQSDVLMSVLQKMGEETKYDVSGEKCYVANYSFGEIRNMTNNPGLQAKRIKKIFDELLDTKVEFLEEGKYTKANLFSHYSLTDKSNAEITLSSELTKKLITDKNEYTILSLDEYVSLPNNYAKELYRLLRQFRHSGIIFVKKEDLLSLLNPPKSYNEYDTLRKVILPAIEVNREYFEDLSMTQTHPNKIPSVCKFTFKKQEKQKIQKLINESSPEDAELLRYITENSK